MLRSLVGSEMCIRDSGAILERHAKIIKKSMPKMIHFGSQKGAQREPKSTPKPTKIEDKNPCEKTSLQDRLGAVLERTWAIWEAILGAKYRLKPCVLDGFVKNHVFKKIAFQEPS